MSFRLRLIYYLVHRLGLSNRAAKKLIADGRVRVGNNTVTENILLSDESAVSVDGTLVKMALKRTIILFHKPRGFESTLSNKVERNLAEFFPHSKDLIIAGRLDKDSEGLLLLSNDGKWVEDICNPVSEKEKEYLVTLDRRPEAQFLTDFRDGVQLGDGKTRPCFCESHEGQTIRVILTEGRNRQIRRMCHKLGVGVTRLKRIRIDRFELGPLNPGEWMEAHS